MRRTIYLLLLLGLVVFCVNISAQQASKGKPPGKARKVFVPPVYLGNSDFWRGPIKKAAFDSLLKQGLKAHDSLGNNYRIIGFDFSYAERNLYEDSAANLEVLFDFSSEYCTGDTLSSDISTSSDATDNAKSMENTPSIYQRSKAGDTAYFDHIRLAVLPGNTILSSRDTTPVLGRGMKFWIVR